jgi:hypothetical protein
MHVITHVAWCSFSSFHSFLSFNMFLWHLLASHSFIILIVLLVAPTPSDALPVNVTLHFPRAEQCHDNRQPPCICDNAWSIFHHLHPERCGPHIFAYESPEHNFLTMVSHRSSLVTSYHVTSGNTVPKFTSGW